MKGISKNFVLTALAVLLSFVAVQAGTPKKGNDPRIQNRDNTLTVAFLNLNQDKYEIRIYSSNNALVHEAVLVNTPYLSGKVFDFKDSVKDYYRIAVVSEGKTVIEERLFLGNL